MTKKLVKIWIKLLIWTIYMTVTPVICQEETENCTCGNSELNESTPSSGRVYGGDDADFNEFPWQAAFIVPYNNQYIGQGSVITTIHALTCAHIFYDVDPLTHQVIVDWLNTPVSAAIGTRFVIKNLSAMTPVEENAYQTRPLAYVVLHPRFVPLVFTYDIAVVEFVTAIPQWYYGLYPVCLAWDNTITYETDLVFFSGYGTTFGDTGLSNLLQKASFHVQPNSICLNQWPAFFTDLLMLCSYNPVQAPCNGDSGGALVYYARDQKYYQIGIYSVGYNCTPGNVYRLVRYYTRVTGFYQWILSVTTNGQYCA